MDLDDELEDIELQNIRTVKTRLKQALDVKVKDLCSKYLFENFEDRLLRWSENLLSTLRGDYRYELFFYLAARQNIMDNEDIDLYIADTLKKFAHDIVIDLYGIASESEIAEFGRNAVNEAEAILLESAPKSNFGLAYKNYLLGAIESYRAELLLEEDYNSHEEEAKDHLKKGIKFLEEAIYIDDHISYVKTSLFLAYKDILSLNLSFDEKESIKGKLSRFNAKYPEVRRRDLRLTAEEDQRIEDLRYSKKHI